MNYKSSIKIMLFLVSLLIILSGSCAYAHSLENVEFDSETFELKVRGKADINPLKDLNDVTIQILKKGKTFDTNINDNNFNDYFYNVFQIPVDENGNFTYSCLIKSIPGVHNVRVVFADATSKMDSFIYGSALETETFLANANAADTVDKMKLVFKNYNYVIEDFLLDDEVIAKFPTIDILGKIAEGMINKNYKKIEDFAKIYNSQTATIYVNLIGNAKGISEIINKNASILGVDEDKVYKKIYTDLHKDKKILICDKLVNKNYGNSDELSKNLAEATILYAVNTVTNWTEIRPIIMQTDKYLKVLKYNDLLAEEKNYVDKKISKSACDTFLNFTIKFNELLEKPYDANTDNSGGSSGTTSYFPPASTIFADNKTDTTKNENFSDLGEVQWAYEAINYLFDKKIINGKSEKIFDPSGKVKREEFVKMVVLALDLNDTEQKCDFKDVNENDWFYNYVALAYKYNILKGINSEYFGVGNYITREDMATIIFRGLANCYDKKPDKNIVNKFADHNQISDYAVDCVYAMKNLGIVSGVDDINFAPKNFATRAQVAKMIYNLLKSEGLK